MTAGEPRKGASRTAEAVCFFRAAERWAEPRVLDDDHAITLLPRFLRRLVESRRACAALFAVAPAEHLRTWVVLRHRALDDVLVRFAESGGRNVIVVGAGFDTRALRFAHLGVSVTEIDRPSSQAVKRRRLRDLPYEARFLPLEITAGALTSALGKQTERTLLLWEGVSMYLERDVVRSSLAEMRALVPDGSVLAWDFSTPPALREKIVFRLGGAALGVLGEPLLFTPYAAEVEAMLDETGWRVDTLRDGNAIADELGAARRALPGHYVVSATATGGERSSPYSQVYGVASGTQSEK